jgi:hypothetical protein
MASAVEKMQAPRSRVAVSKTIAARQRPNAYAFENKEL